MSVPIEARATARWPITRTLFAFLVCALIGWQVLVAAGAAWLADTGAAEQALALDPANPVANMIRAQTAYASHDLATARAYAKRTLEVAPIDQQAVTIIGLTGPKQTLASTLALSAALGWRDLTTQLYLAGIGIQQGAAVLFAQRFDAYQRQIEHPFSVLRSLDSYIADPQVQTAMAERLSTQPDWRGSYIGWLDSDDPRVVAGREALLGLLASGPAPPTSDELSTYVRRLNEFGFHTDARRVWTRFVARRDAWSGFLYDGGFHNVVERATPFPYDWTVQGSSAGYATVETDGHGDALHVHSDGDGMVTLASQQLRFSPGRYRLTAQADRHDDTSGTADGGFVWSLACGDQQLIGTSYGAGGPAAAGVRSYDFAVPGDCSEPLLSVVTTAGEPGQTYDLWIERARIDWIGGAAPAPAAQ